MDDEWRSRLKKAIQADGRKPRTVSLAAKLGPNYLGEVLKKGKVPGIDKLLRLCSELNVSATYILSGADVSPQSEEMQTILSRLPSDRQETLLTLARQLQEAEQR